MVALNSFQDMMDDQKDILRGQVEKNVKQLQTNVDKFSRRWESAKPTIDADEMTTEMANSILGEINDWKAEMQNMEAAVKEIKEDMEHFGMEAVSFDALDEMRKVWFISFVYFCSSSPAILILGHDPTRFVLVAL